MLQVKESINVLHEYIDKDWWMTKLNYDMQGEQDYRLESPSKGNMPAMRFSMRMWSFT